MTLLCGVLPTLTTQMMSRAHTMPPLSVLFQRLLQKVLGVQTLLCPWWALMLVKGSWWGVLRGRSPCAQVTLVGVTSLASSPLVSTVGRPLQPSVMRRGWLGLLAVGIPTFIPARSIHACPSFSPGAGAREP